jgi:hypothetical protein
MCSTTILFGQRFTRSRIDQVSPTHILKSTQRLFVVDETDYLAQHDYVACGLDK